ncbi:hypothetical protein PCE1_001562 [Barthelona sp. PCE]
MEPVESSPNWRETQYCPFCLDNDNPTPYCRLQCGHQVHESCMLIWMHHGHDRCPLCCKSSEWKMTREIMIDINEFKWRIYNVSYPSSPTQNSFRNYGWHTVRLKITPPPYVDHITRIKYVLHPAFSLSKVDLHEPPHELVIKLCSNNVPVVVQVYFVHKVTGKVDTFTMQHCIVKETSNWNYFCGNGDVSLIYNGLQSEENQVLSPNSHFKDLLTLYKRPDDYYASPLIAVAHEERENSRENQQKVPLDE